MTVEQDLKEELLSPELVAMCNDSAKKYGVVPSIHPRDFIFKFLLNNPCFQSSGGAVEYYFRDGANSSNKLAKILYQDLQFKKDRPLKLLEFASGYGCVTRHLLKEFLNANIIPCDIHNDAINFIKENFLLEAMLSESIPENLTLTREYDVIFALSFFSHMPESSWGRWVKTLFQGLKINGFLIFTTQGKESAKYFGNPIIPPNGFWFLPDSEQKDLDNQEYGQTIVTPDFAIGEIYRQIRAPMVSYRHAFWWEHQDLYVIQNNMR